MPLIPCILFMLSCCWGILAGVGVWGPAPYRLQWHRTSGVPGGWPLRGPSNVSGLSWYLLSLVAPGGPVTWASRQVEFLNPTWNLHCRSENPYIRRIPKQNGDTMRIAIERDVEQAVKGNLDFLLLPRR